jgi:osmotically-inducible protein OsmY
MSDQTLQEEVAEEIHWDPKVDAKAIAVSAKDGVVTLRGTIGTFHQKREATKAAQRVRGVVRVDNQLEVELMTDQRRADADIRGDVLQALMLDAWVPASVDATVREGVVTLGGSVERQYQRDEAVHVAGNVSGVVAVDNKVKLIPSVPDAHDVQHSVKKALERDAKIEAEHLDVEASPGGTVTLKGNVRSVYERDAAVAAAWAAPGVRHVDDQLNVLY